MWSRVGWQPRVLPWAHAASGTLSSNLFGCQMYSLGKWGSWAVQEMAQEEDSYSRWQAEKLSRVNVLHLCASPACQRFYFTPCIPLLLGCFSSLTCSFLALWASFLPRFSQECSQFFLLHRVFLTPKKPFMSQMQLPTGTMLQEKT